MSGQNKPSRFQNPTGFIVVAVVSATLVVAFGLGFLILPRYQESRAPFSTKDTLYHALGFHIHGKGFNTIQPTLKVPTYIAWTETTIQHATAGDRKGGELIATNCTACHGEKGLSSQSWIPSLAGLDRLVQYKQLDDFRSGTRLSGPMSAIAQSLTPQQYADVSAYFASLPGLPEDRGERAPRAGSSYRNSDPVRRLIYAGDPKRGIAACASCHGPGGYRIGAPALARQNELYLEQQLQAFAQGTRANDMDMPMRTIAGALTDSEIRALAHAYAIENAKGP
jgi:cytochrome c553